MIEEWRDIKGYEGLYQVSNCGNVRSVARVVTWKNGSVKTYKSRMMKTRIKGGYVSASLYKNYKSKEFKVHRLVAEAFIPNPNDLPFINHIDEDKANNTVDNLEWCTRQYNNNYGQRNEKISMAQRKKALEKRIAIFNEIIDKHAGGEWMKDRNKRDLQKAIDELTAEYTKALESDFVFKPMAYTLFHLWQKWDAKENARLYSGVRE